MDAQRRVSRPEQSVQLMIEAGEAREHRMSALSTGSFSRDSSSHCDEISVGGTSMNSGYEPNRASRDHESHEKQRELVKQMAAQEGQKVKIWRRNVFLVVFLTAAFVTAMTYIFLDREDKEDFEQSFREFAQTIEESTEFNLKGLVEGTNGLSQVLTSEAINTNSTWPFMTLSSFEVYVRNTRAQSASEFVVFAPFVQPDEIEQWNEYSNQHQGWIDQSFQEYDTGRLDLNPIPSSLYRFGRFKGRTVLKPEDGYGAYPSAPFWQMSRPPFDTSIVNFNAMSEESYQLAFQAMNASRHWVMGIAGPNTLIDYTISAEQHDQLHSASEQDNNTVGFANGHPHTQLIYPVFASKDPTHPSGGDIHSPMVAMIVNILPWDNYLKRLLPPGVDGLVCVLHNSAGQAFTYRIRGPNAAYLGAEDLHDTKYDDMEYRIDFDEFLGVNATTINNPNALSYWFSVYPSAEFQASYDTNTPIVFAVVVALSFSFMTITFILYDRYVVRKNNKILDAATHSNAILASLFPKNVKERLLEEKANEIKDLEASKKQKKNNRNAFMRGSTAIDEGLQIFLQTTEFDDLNGQDEILQSDPIADLFPEATILFADLVGFTAWSSTREPTQVFILLETLYRNFDLIAKRRRVYKIETIGDCYVAVTGCPTPRKNHHRVMVRFCMECLQKMRKLTRKLESKLGPDTSTLDMRFGLHSGPVTGGVLRGERSRFQLFGDTMNTAARMESNGKPGKVHMSEATANLLRQHGKGHWLEMREDKVQAKGKGLMQTYWLAKNTGDATESATESVWSDDDPSSALGEEGRASTVAIKVGDLGEVILDEKIHRVVEWTTQSLMTLLEKLDESKGSSGEVEDFIPVLNKQHKSMPLDELKEVIAFPEQRFSLDDNGVLLGQDIEDQLELFVAIIASKYPGHNSFHNFFHASHVTMTLLKLFSAMQNNAKPNNRGKTDALGIRMTFDPLTVFACAFAALIHDTEHPGVPNFIFKNEDPHMAGLYAGRSIAEQHSFDVAWKLLSEERFKGLRSKIVRTEEEAIRFRQLVVNAVIATDLFDGELNKQRSDGWDKAFASEEAAHPEESLDQVLDRKATIVIDHLIQGADISHCMQHWQIYRKWNTNLFEEMYKAFIDGRSNKDPSLSWYQGELSFFDGHVIPLAERLVSCKCFGVTAEEFLSNAQQNKTEWAEKGDDIVAEMVEEMRTNIGQPPLEGKGEDPSQSITNHETMNTAEISRLADILAVTETALESFQEELEEMSIGSTSC